jgi:transposase-like protein
MESKKKQPRTQKGQQVMDFTDEQAREYFERLRWPHGPACVHCGSVDVYRLQGKSTRPGLLECRDCRKQFTVTVNSVMEDSHLPLRTWARAFHLMCSSKKGVSALQLQRNLGLGSYRTAWFLAHRIREAMNCEPVADLLRGQVQCDEAYVGGKPRKGEDAKPKQPVLVLVETNGRARSQPIQNADQRTLRDVLTYRIDPLSQIVTDDWSAYPFAAHNFAGGHQTVNHSNGEYARRRINEAGALEIITTNTAESYFSLLKRGIYGVPPSQ